MVRAFVAWSLLILAASPFTAPFATCDLLTLLLPGSHTPQTLEIDAAPASFDDGEALSLSPITKKTVVANPLRALGSFRLAVSDANAPLRLVAAEIKPPHDASRKPQEYFARTPILRV